MTQEVAAQTETLTSPWKAVYTFRRRLRDGWGEAFKGMIVFGSLARGDWSPDSDVDVMVLLDDAVDRKAESRRIWNIAFELYEDSEIEVQPLVVTETQYRRGSAPLYFNIRREGWWLTPEDQPRGSGETPSTGGEHSRRGGASTGERIVRWRHLPWILCHVQRCTGGARVHRHLPFAT